MENTKNRVYTLYHKGLTNRQISDELGVNIRSIQRHLKSLNLVGHIEKQELPSISDTTISIYKGAELVANIEELNELSTILSISPGKINWIAQRIAETGREIYTDGYTIKVSELVYLRLRVKHLESKLNR